MSYLVIWVRPGDNEKQYQVFGDRRSAETVALSRRNQGCEAYVEDTALQDASSLPGGMIGAGMGGLKA